VNKANAETPQDLFLAAWRAMILAIQLPNIDTCKNHCESLG
jgi:hypothetical protein